MKPMFAKCEKIRFPAWRLSVADESHDPAAPIAHLAVVGLSQEEERQGRSAAVLLSSQDAETLIAILRAHFGLD